jgi:hypothetical protein
MSKKSNRVFVTDQEDVSGTSFPSSLGDEQYRGQVSRSRKGKNGMKKIGRKIVI